MTRHAIRLGHAIVQVPDIDASIDFLTTRIRFAHEERDGVHWFIPRGEYGTSGQPGVGLVAGDQTKLRQVTVDLQDNALDAIREALSARNQDWSEDAAGIRTTDPVGTPLLLSVPRNEQWPQPTAQNAPRRLGHINFRLPKVLEAGKFWQDVVGMKKSEQIGVEFMFLRFGSEHHNLGLREGDGPIIHHMGFQMPGWDAYREVCDHLASTGDVIEYGPGRHGPGNNIFIYVRDPSSGLRFELFTDMEHIHDEEHFVAPQWRLEDRPRTMNKWGPAPAHSFLYE